LLSPIKGEETIVVFLHPRKKKNFSLFPLPWWERVRVRGIKGILLYFYLHFSQSLLMEVFSFNIFYFLVYFIQIK